MGKPKQEPALKTKLLVREMAAAMGIEILTEEQYFELQTLGEFDTKRSNWIKTPEDIRKLGGALYCDRRYGRVLVGHNGAESYYSGQGWFSRPVGGLIEVVRPPRPPWIRSGRTKLRLCLLIRSPKSLCLF